MSYVCVSWTGASADSGTSFNSDWFINSFIIIVHEKNVFIRPLDTKIMTELK